MSNPKALAVSPEDEPKDAIVRQFLTANEIVARATLIQQVKERVMKSGVHYGTVPGCGDKPTLLKPGAEKILAVFQIAVEPQIEDLSTADSVRYRITTKAIHQVTGAYLGSGLGEASTNEEKWKWRRAWDEEYADTPEDRRRKKTKDRKIVLQIRTNPADLANTVLKMAKKRSLVDLALTVTGSSDFFEQDLEEMTEDQIETVLNEEHGRKPIKQPKAKEPAKKAPQEKPEEPRPAPGEETTPAPEKITAEQVATLTDAIRKKGMLKADVTKRLFTAHGVSELKDLGQEEVNAFAAWVGAWKKPVEAAQP